jgi:hypothetical protein
LPFSNVIKQALVVVGGIAFRESPAIIDRNPVPQCSRHLDVQENQQTKERSPCKPFDTFPERHRILQQMTPVDSEEEGCIGGFIPPAGPRGRSSRDLVLVRWAAWLVVVAFIVLVALVIWGLAAHDPAPGGFGSGD